MQSLVQWAQHPYRMFYTEQKILDWSSRMSVPWISRAVYLYGRLVELCINVWYNPSSKAVKSCLEARGLRAQPEGREERTLDWSSRILVLWIRRAVCLYGRLV